MTRYPPTRERARRLLSPLVAAIWMAGCGSGPGAGDEPAPTAAAPRPAVEGLLTAGFLVVDGVYNTELTAPWDVFQHTLHHLPAGSGIEVLTISPDGGTVTTAEGLRLQTDHSFASSPPLDILVVPSAEGSRDRDREDRRLIGWLREAGERARFVVSLCWGAFLLAEAGLLDGHACTTFPADYGRFAEAFPALDLRINVSFVHDRRVLTSEGGVRSYDAALYLVDHLYGPGVARAVGSGLLVPWPPRAGERPAFVSEPELSGRRPAPSP